MKLKTMTLSNFRCYKNSITLALDDMTTLVGRNDAGKSSLLDALDVFFNERALDKNDAAKGGDAKAVTITCVFTELPAELVLDDNAATVLADECLLNVDGDLEITKVYNCSIERPKLTSLRLRAVHPTVVGARDLLSLKVDGLKARADELGVDTSAVNRAVKHSLRRAIRAHLNVLDPAQIDLVLAGDGVEERSNVANIWEGLKAALPLFAVFRSDRQSSDQDSEAQDPLKTAIKEALSARAADLQSIMNFVEQEVKKVADLTLSKLNEMDPAVAASLSPKFERPNWASLIKASITGDDDIPLNKRGSGVRRLILLNFFRAKAERAMRERVAPSTIYAVEEPETSQHPHNQRMLMRALQQLAVSGDQVIVTTHTPLLARSVPAASLRFLSRDAIGQRRLQVGGTDEVNRAIAESLGVIPDHTVKVFIVVEGIHDVTFFKSLSKLLISHGNEVPDVESLERSGELIFVPAGGADNLAFWASRLAAFDRPEFHLYDRDAPPHATPKHQAKVDAVNLRPNCAASSTSRNQMENYVHHRAMNAYFQSKGAVCNVAAPYGPDDDVPKLLRDELNLHAPAGGKWGESRLKGILAEYVLPSMDANMLGEIDPAGEMLGWMLSIRTMLAPPPVPPEG